MVSDEIVNLCCDFLALSRYESAVRLLLASPKGQWISLAELMRQDGGAIDSDLFVTWLDDPYASRGWVCVVFHHYDPIWSMCAHYNSGRLFGDHECGRLLGAQHKED